MSPQDPPSSQAHASSHRIRLPAPWQATRAPANAAAATPSTATSRVIFRRSFQRPTGLAAQSAVTLEVTLLERLSIQVALNGTACATVPRSDLVFEIPLSPDQLQPVNQLEITVEVPAPATAVAAGMEQPMFGKHYIAQVALLMH